MPFSIRVAQLGGTTVRLHLAFVLVLVWAAVLGVQQYGTAQGAAFNTLLVLFLFVCVLIHELAHFVFAARVGIEASEVTLLPFGGAITLDTSGIAPKDEIRIVLAGPAANIVLTVFFSLLVVLLLHPISERALIDAITRPSLPGLLCYVAAANFLLGLFNLTPALPLDGGRALRAYLSRRMTYSAATRIVAIFGRSNGAGTVAIGVSLMVVGMVSSMPISYGAALTFVGVLLYSDATREDRRVRQTAILYHQTVGEFVQPAAITVAPDDPLSVALPMVIRGHVVPVVLDDRLVGVVTLREMARIPPGARTAHVMRTRYPSVRPSDPLAAAYEKLRRSDLIALPVVAGGQLQGVILLKDILRALRDSAATKDA
jgi:Zn-dependent protease